MADYTDYADDEEFSGMPREERDELVTLSQRAL